MSRRALFDRSLGLRGLERNESRTFRRRARCAARLRRKWSPILRDPATSFLELAADYGACGLWDEAVNVLSQYILTAEDKARISPLVRYHLGYYL